MPDMNTNPDSGAVSGNQAQPGHAAGQVSTGDNQYTATEGQQQGGAPDKFSGKSREEIIEIYQNAEKKIGEQGSALGNYKKAIDRISPFFEEVEPGGDWKLNEQMMKKYAETVLGYGPTSNGQQVHTPAVSDPSTEIEAFQEEFDKNPQQTLDGYFEKRLKGHFEKDIQPQLDQIAQKINTNQANEVLETFEKTIGKDEFSRWKDKMVQHRDKFNMQMNESNKQTAFDGLVNLYNATKGYHGALVDKNQSDTNIAELQKAMTVFGGSPVSGPADLSAVSNAELFGLGSQGTDLNSAASTLFGKSIDMLDPGK